MTKSIRVGFAGARRASSFFKAFQAHPDTEIVALCDINEQTLAEAGDATGITQLYTVYDKMLDEAKLDAAYFFEDASERTEEKFQEIEKKERIEEELKEIKEKISPAKSPRGHSRR